MALKNVPQLNVKMIKKSISKLLIIFFLFLTIFFLTNISAEGCWIETSKSTCESTEGNYAVMKLSAPTNAHGELISGTSYDNVLCCDFGTGNINCVETPSSNKIIGLSSPTNAHAEEPAQTNYLEKVCYEDLICDAFYDGCGVGTALDYPLGILSLSSTTNAHIALYEGTGSYDVKICCKSAGVFGQCSLTSAEWNMENAEEGQQVYLEVIGSGEECADQSVSFEVWEDDPLEDDPVTTNPSPVNFNSDGTATGLWFAEYQDDGTLGGDPEYYFVASLTDNPETNIESSDPKLSVTQQTPGEINICEDYDDELNCESYAIQVAENSAEGLVDCDDENIECRCVWDDDAEGTEEDPKCTFGYIPIDPGEDCDPETDPPCCEPGEELCSDNVCRDDCSSVGTNCDNDGTCDSNEGCSCIDCDGEQASCDSGTVCSEYYGKCVCNYGFTLCTDSSGISYCNLGATCPVGDEPLSNGDDICEFGEGCLSDGCNDGDQDTCLLDTYCLSGKCSSVEGPPEEGFGMCKLTQVIESKCKESPVGMRTLRVVGTWVGEGGCGSECIECQALGDDLIIAHCPAQIELPFFGSYSIIIIIALVALVYVFLELKEKKKLKKKSGSKRKK